MFNRSMSVGAVAGISLIVGCIALTPSTECYRRYSVKYMPDSSLVYKVELAPQNWLPDKATAPYYSESVYFLIINPKLIYHLGGIDEGWMMEKFDG